MRVFAKKLADESLAQRACQYTLYSHAKSKIPLRKLYGAEHSPLRTQMFWVELDGIPAYVSTHFVRHKIGIEHFVSTRRLDRGATVVADRNSSVDHAFICNAQSLINMSRKRLCTNADATTRKIMEYIRDAIFNIDPALAEFMVIDCEYRGACYEPKCCGKALSFWDKTHSTGVINTDKISGGCIQNPNHEGIQGELF